jgi:hypothetical protein
MTLLGTSDSELVETLKIDWTFVWSCTASSRQARDNATSAIPSERS